MPRPTVYELSKLYLSLPDQGEFRANLFANGKNARALGKMLTRLEDAGFLASRRLKDAKAYWKIPVIPDLLNMHMRRCMEGLDEQRSLHEGTAQPIQRDFTRKS